MNLLEFWHNLSQVGINANSSWQRNRHIILCNRVAAIVSVMTLLLALVSLVYFGPIIPVLLAFVVSFVFLLPLLFNYWQYHNGSRMFLSVSLSIASIFISIFDKFDVQGQLEEFQYFHFRLMLLVASLFPMILFRLTEKKYWIGASLVNAICIIFYDPLHELFGVGYYQVGFLGPNYYFLNYMVITTAIVLIGSTYFLKFSFEKTENKNEELIKNLNQANQVIHQQQNLLALENIQLSRDLVEKNNQLSETNEELVRHNNELLQFSYTVSHNLRGPVASLGGLMNLFNQQSLTEENKELIDHLNRSLQSLETTIRDLSHIIDIRNNLSRIRQKIILDEELDQVKVLLEKEIFDHQVAIEYNFSEAAEIYAVKHMVDSILYNLISNAIKYRSPDRKPHIRITSTKADGQIILSVEDNGLGLDVGKYKEKLFGLYKRFHTHTDGRGLGLFLVKLQTQSMGGTIDVSSKLGAGSTFTITLPIPQTLSEQILLDNAGARLYYDASLNAVGIHWKQKVSNSEFKEFLLKAVDFVKTFQTPNWISNVSNVTDRDEEDLNQLRQRVRADLKQAGLKRIATIMPKVNFPDYEQRRNLMKPVFDADTQFFESLEEAKRWLAEQNKVS
jgi:signal transduction histidine kinase